MALLTEDQLREIRQIIADHHSAFIANTISPDVLAAEVKQRLQDKGLINVQVQSIEDAYLYGQVLATMDDPKLATMSYDQLKAHLRKNPVALTDIEKTAVTMAQQRAAQYVQGLGTKIDQMTGQVLIQEDAALRQKMRDEIRTATAENVARRESVKSLKRDLAELSGDWIRDWDRVAVTEKHTAMQEGLKDHYGKRYGGDVRVFCRVMPDACKHCRRLYLGPDGQPRIFRLKDLEANGTNVGRKAANWLPTIPPIHAHCQCQMMRMPAGWGFNEAGEMVPGGELGVEYQSEADLKLALMQEADLRKALTAGQQVDFQGLPIHIENPAGSVRKWTAPDGEKGKTTMLYAYGEIVGTQGADADPIDVFLGPDPRASMVYIVHQQDPHTGRYDEEKVMLGWSSQSVALSAYKAHYNRQGFDVSVTPMQMDQFKRWAGLTTGPLKQGKPVTPHVVPLQKASPGPDLVSTGKAHKVVGSGASTSAAARSTGPGVGANVVFKVPEKPNPPPVDKEQLEPRMQPADPTLRAVKRDLEDYTVTEPLHNQVKPLVIPIDYPGRGKVNISPEEQEENKQYLLKEKLKNQPATRNRAEVEGSE